MKTLFNYVKNILQFIASLSGLSYAAVNIIVYYYFIPFIYIIIIDKIFGVHYLKIAYIITVSLSLIVIKDFEKFSMRLFIQSQDFLKSFSFIGLDYVLASIIICVLIPFAIMIALIYCIIK